eukprot:scaffold59634_cov20-Tisochrysis_lutea.AAC.2
MTIGRFIAANLLPVRSLPTTAVWAFSLPSAPSHSPTCKLMCCVFLNYCFFRSAAAPPQPTAAAGPPLGPAAAYMAMPGFGPMGHPMFGPGARACLCGYVYVCVCFSLRVTLCSPRAWVPGMLEMPARRSRGLNSGQLNFQRVTLRPQAADQDLSIQDVHTTVKFWWCDKAALHWIHIHAACQASGPPRGSVG